MMNANKTKLAMMLSVGAMTMALTGCGGDGNEGQPGQPGGIPADTATVLNINYDNVAINNGIATVNFSVANEEDLPVVGLQKIRFASAQLLPANATSAGNASQWQYFGGETCDLRGECVGTFVDHKNGQYSYTFAKNLNNDSEIDFNPQLSHRVLLRSYPVALPSGAMMPNTNSYIDFDPTTGGDALYSRSIVTTETCNSCHGDIGKTAHKGSFTDVADCATCHSKGNVSASAEFTTLAHNLHKDVNLGGLQNCQGCHVESEEAPEWNNWSRIPTMESCSSCHTNIDFVNGKGHSEQADNSNCVACHNSQWTTDVHMAKQNDQDKLLAQYSIDAKLVANTDKTATLTVGINDANGKPADIAMLLKQIHQLETITNVGPNYL